MEEMNLQPTGELIKTRENGVKNHNTTKRREKTNESYAVHTVLFLQKCFDVRAWDWLQNVVATCIDPNTEQECKKKLFR
jgi:hypothetical protein